MAVSKATLLATLKKARQTADVRYGVSVEKQATAESGFAATYVLKQGGAQIGSKINIPKDFLVKGCSLEVVSAADKAEGGKFATDNGFAVGNKYIDFEVNTKGDGDGNTETTTHLYINVNELVDVYQNGNGLALDQATNTFSVQLDSGNTHGLAVSESGLSLALAVASESGVGGSAGAISATDKEKLDGIEDGANAYTHPTYTATTGAETADVTPAFGGTFNISQVSTDTTGHVTGQTTRTITIPNNTATAATNGAGGTAGLMSAVDKETLDKLQASSDETISDAEIAGIFADD